MTKYKQIYQEMVEQNSEAFKDFKQVHDLYCLDPEQWQERYNNLGKPILDIIHVWEGRLCGKMEGSGRGLFSGGVAQKFWDEVRVHFPKIDMVGVKRS